jgi:hypothetical protein
MLDALKTLIDFISSPSISFTLILVAFPFVFPPTSWFERWHRRLHIHLLWTKRGGIVLFILLTLYFVMGFADDNFSLILTKPDNMPIIILMYSSVFFLWLSMHSAYENDARLADGEKVAEWYPPKEKVLVWPDLVYIEFIALIIMTVFLLLWSIALPAPLEEAANPNLSPNPAKAPWYFLALQEMLVYFDPWLAGVVFPSLIILGLMSIPYLDRKKEGSGYYSFADRRVSIFIFMFGWLVLWIFLIVVGTFFRGPNWNFFGPFEEWSVTKVVPLSNINLSEYIWVKMFRVGMPSNPIVREAVGILLLIGYFGLTPVILAKNRLNHLLERLGPTRYGLLMILALSMLFLPIKMYLRWTLNLKYIIAIPEAFFNI